MTCDIYHVIASKRAGSYVYFRLNSIGEGQGGTNAPPLLLMGGHCPPPTFLISIQII